MWNLETQQSPSKNEEDVARNQGCGISLPLLTNLSLWSSALAMPDASLRLPRVMKELSGISRNFAQDNGHLRA